MSKKKDALASTRLSLKADIAAGTEPLLTAYRLRVRELEKEIDKQNTAHADTIIRLAMQESLVKELRDKRKVAR